MDRDRELLRWAFSDDNAVPVLRFFLWNPPTASVGYNQPLEQLDLRKCERLGIPVVKRPTGGRAIYHHTEFTYSVVIPPWHWLSRMSVLNTYNRLSCALLEGLRNIGIDAKLSRGTRGDLSRNPSCFSSTSRYELVVDGKKLVGSAQRRKNGAVLQQGSIMAGPQYIRLAEIIRENGEAVKDELMRHSTYIQKVIGRIPPYEEFVEAMVAGFRTALSSQP